MRTMKTRSGREPPGAPELDADHAVTVLYQLHYPSLVRLAALLVPDLATAEDIVQDCFAAMHDMWHALPGTDAALPGTDAALPGTDAALCYLRRLVVRRSRSAPRLQLAGGTETPGLPGSAVMAALRALPVRQREVLVLRYFADLPVAEIASATGMSTAAVRSHAARAMSSLRAELHPGG